MFKSYFALLNKSCENTLLGDNYNDYYTRHTST